MGRNAEHNFFLFLLLMLLLLRGIARADDFSGSAELFEQVARTRNVDSDGLATVSKSTFFFQRYRLEYNRPVLPQVFLQAGMRVEKQDLQTDTEGNKSKLTSTVLMPYAGLTFANPFVRAGVSYDVRDEKVESGGTSVRTIRETNNAFLGLRPEGLPTLDLLYTDQKRHDADRTSIDLEDRQYTLTSAYRPVRTVQLSYTATYDDNEQHITQTETKSLAQSGRVSYGDRFFDDRMAFGTNYIVTRQDTQFTRATATGTVQAQLFPLAGLSAINDTPIIGVLAANPALIDGNLVAGSGLNIGQTPSLSGDIKKRNAGLDFGLPSDVNTLFVWVDRQLPSAVANSFIWEIYVSQDNQNWSLHQTVFPAVFGLLDNRFEIAFIPVTTRYIMAVTRPLSVAVVPPPGVDVSSIFITELQAFNDRPFVLAAGTSAKTALNSESIDANTRVNILRMDRHTVLYDLYYIERVATGTGQPLTRVSTLTNALTANEKFNRVLSGDARVLRQDDETPVGPLTTYNYSAALTAAMNSLPKLSHVAVLSGRREEIVQSSTTRDTGSLSLTNTAEVYPGINAFLGGTENLVSTTTDTEQSRVQSTVVSFGTQIIPHRTMTINLNYDWTETEQQGEIFVLTAPTTRRKSTLASVAYTPFSSLYLFGSIQRVEETGRPGITAGIFTGSWSAQRTGGALELRFGYSENFETETRTRTRNYGPSARWKINARTFLDVAYTVASIDTPLNKSETTALNANLKVTL
jgi:hypothetical protein